MGIWGVRDARHLGFHYNASISGFDALRFASDRTGVTPTQRLNAQMSIAGTDE